MTLGLQGSRREGFGPPAFLVSSPRCWEACAPELDGIGLGCVGGFGKYPVESCPPPELTGSLPLTRARPSLPPIPGARPPACWTGSLPLCPRDNGSDAHEVPLPCARRALGWSHALCLQLAHWSDKETEVPSAHTRKLWRQTGNQGRSFNHCGLRPARLQAGDRASLKVGGLCLGLCGEHMVAREPGLPRGPSTHLWPLPGPTHLLSSAQCFPSLPRSSLSDVCAPLQPLERPLPAGGWDVCVHTPLAAGAEGTRGHPTGGALSASGVSVGPGSRPLPGLPACSGW